MYIAITLQTVATAGPKVCQAFVVIWIPNSVKTTMRQDMLDYAWGLTIEFICSCTSVGQGTCLSLLKPDIPLPLMHVSNF